jgi:hypothetical protein
MLELRLEVVVQGTGESALQATTLVIFNDLG